MNKKFIKMNVALAGFSQGQQWPYEEAPAVAKMWLEKKCILVEERICSLVCENGKPFFLEPESIKEDKITKTITQINQAKMDKLLGDEDDKTVNPLSSKPEQKK